MKPQLCFFFKKPLVPLTARLYKTYFARQEIVFECLLLSELTPSLFWIYFVVFPLVDLLFYDGKTL